MWSKSREKKAMAKYYTRNFGTGYVEADEYHLNRVGLRGRKRWLLLSAVLLGYVIVLGHLAVRLTYAFSVKFVYNLVFASVDLFVIGSASF